MVLPRISTNVSVIDLEPRPIRCRSIWPRWSGCAGCRRRRWCCLARQALPRPARGASPRLQQHHERAAGRCSRACAQAPCSASDILPVLFRRARPASDHLRDGRGRSRICMRCGCRAICAGCAAPTASGATAGLTAAQALRSTSRRCGRGRGRSAAPAAVQADPLDHLARELDAQQALGGRIEDHAGQAVAGRLGQAHVARDDGRQPCRRSAPARVADLLLQRHARVEHHPQQADQVQQRGSGLACTCLIELDQVRQALQREVLRTASARSRRVRRSGR